MKNTYYIHSTGVIKGPNKASKKMNSRNSQRAEWGNLFTSRKAAEKAKKRMEKSLKGRVWKWL